MVLSVHERDSLIGLLEDLTQGELSTLVVALGELKSQIGTSTDSANYAFLKRLCELGFAEEVPLDVDLPPDLQAVLRSVLISESAKPEITDLLKQLSRMPGRSL